LHLTWQSVLRLGRVVEPEFLIEKTSEPKPSITNESAITAHSHRQSYILATQVPWHQGEKQKSVIMFKILSHVHHQNPNVCTTMAQSVQLASRQPISPTHNWSQHRSLASPLA
jgi:hypothetical protein